MARAKAKDPLTREALRERVTKLERAAEVHLLGVPESQANMQNAQGVAAVIVSLKGERSAVVQLGPLLIVKVPSASGDSIILTRTLGPQELRELERNPILLTDPIRLVAHYWALSNSSWGNEIEGEAKEVGG